MTYQKNEKIEVLDDHGNWLPGRYIFLSAYTYDEENLSECLHIVECFDLDYCLIRIPDNKIRKLVE